MAREIVIEASPGSGALSVNGGSSGSLRLATLLENFSCKEAAAALSELHSALEVIAGSPGPGMMLNHAGVDLWEESRLVSDAIVSSSLAAAAQASLAQTSAKLRAGISFDLGCLDEKEPSKMRRNRKNGLTEYISTELPNDLRSLHLAETLRATFYADNGEFEAALTALGRHASSLADLLAHKGWKNCEKADRAAIGKAAAAAELLARIATSAIEDEKKGEPARPHREEQRTP